MLTNMLSLSEKRKRRILKYQCTSLFKCISVACTETSLLSRKTPLSFSNLNWFISQNMAVSSYCFTFYGQHTLSVINILLIGLLNIIQQDTHLMMRCHLALVCKVAVCGGQSPSSCPRHGVRVRPSPSDLPRSSIMRPTACLCLGLRWLPCTHTML